MAYEIPSALDGSKYKSGNDSKTTCCGKGCHHSSKQVRSLHNSRLYWRIVVELVVEPHFVELVGE